MVFWEGYVGASPSLISAIQALEEEGFRVDLITREAAEGFPEIPVFADSTRVTDRPEVRRYLDGALHGVGPASRADRPGSSAISIDSPDRDLTSDVGGAGCRVFSGLCCCGLI